MISDSQLSKVAAGGSDNWVEKTLGRKIVHPLKGRLAFLTLPISTTNAYRACRSTSLASKTWT